MERIPILKMGEFLLVTIQVDMHDQLALTLQEDLTARISATGLSERQPVTAVADCPDSLSRARLIDCLQPDRRVEIEVTGTR